MNITGTPESHYADEIPLVTNRIKQCELNKFSANFGSAFQIYYQIKWQYKLFCISTHSPDEKFDFSEKFEVFTVSNKLGMFCQGGVLAVNPSWLHSKNNPGKLS